MRGKERGITGVGIVVGVAVLAVVVLVILYFASDVFRTKANTAYTDMTEWTPENIAADPVNYLNFCEAETKKALTKLKASEISIAQERAKLEQKRVTAAEKVGVAEGALGELKTLYRAAEETSAWPISWKGQDRTKEFAQRQIILLNSQKKGNAGLLAKIDNGLKSLEIQKGRVADHRMKCDLQLTEIATNRQALEIQEITDDLTENLVSMKGVIVSSFDLANDSGTLTVEQIMAAEGPKIDEDEFAAIMDE